MASIFHFEVRRTQKYWASYFLGLIYISAGFFIGSSFNLSFSEGLYLNSAFSLGYVIGLLSLSVIFIANLYALPLLFKDQDSRFEEVLFALPISKKEYVGDRFLFFFLKTFLSFFLLIIAFAIGQLLRNDFNVNPEFHFFHYLYPLLVFGLLNSFLVCSFLFMVAQTSRNKLLLIIAGLLLYVLYMLVMVFSNSPFMSSSIPQSITAEQISGILDPFGLSAYFSEAKKMSIADKNQHLVALQGSLLINRLIYFIISVGLLLYCFKSFDFRVNHSKFKRPKKAHNEITRIEYQHSLLRVKPRFDRFASFNSILSLCRIDLKYLFKGIFITSISILLLFFVGMEMYAEIEKGIRIPEKFASSGLMAVTISENFYTFGLLIVVYFCNDIFWRNKVSNFHLIETSSYYSKNKNIAHFLTLSILILFFSVLLIVEGIIFQISYGYFVFDFKAYAGVFLFNSLPIILFASFILLINNLFKNRFVALGVSTFALFLFTGPISRKVFQNPLLQIFSDFHGVYSDFNGYGFYPGIFSLRLLFGICVLLMSWLLWQSIRTKKLGIWKIVLVAIIVLTAGISAVKYLKHYIPEDQDKAWQLAADYELKYKNKYQNIPQPTITRVNTEISLFPSKNSYKIKATYTLENKSKENINEVLISFPDELDVITARLIIDSQTIALTKDNQEVKLQRPFYPSKTARMEFEIAYNSYAVNGHQSFNSIIENGSFMRISRYFPLIGYHSNYELDDEKLRTQFKLGTKEELKSVNAAANSIEDFMNLSMVVSTEKDQIAVGTGDLKDQWTNSGRNFYKYLAKNIPFRFAVSSGKYHVKKSKYKGIDIYVYYHPNHAENVEQLIENTKSSLEYCIKNFGPYPFKSVQFAEISTFTEGFAGTAYPASIFMPENMVFHANLQGRQEEDVINELAGHELSHLWWGNSQIDPDQREGATMLTESLAMYTEMMLYKHEYGLENMKKRLKIHEQIFESQKGFAENEPLYKVKSENFHISYSLGAMAMVKLSEILTEEKVNTALSSFLKKNSYPKKPSSIDLINEFLEVSPNEKIKQIVKEIFMKPW